MAEKPCGKPRAENDGNKGADSPGSDAPDPEVASERANSTSSDESCLKTRGVTKTCFKQASKATASAVADRGAPSDSESDSDTEPNDPICLKKAVAPGSASGSDADGEMSSAGGSHGEDTAATDGDQAQEEPDAVKQRKKDERAQTKAGWNLSEDGKLRGMKEGGASWAEIAKAVCRDPGECWHRWEELQTTDPTPSPKSEEPKEEEDFTDEERQQHEYLIQHIWPALYGDAGVGLGPSLDVAATAALGAVRRRADRIRLLELQAALANEIGRMIPLEMIATTLERSEG